MSMCRSYFQAVVVSVLLYGCIKRTLTNHIKEKKEENYIRMLQAVHPTKQQLYCHNMTNYPSKTYEICGALPEETKKNS